MCVLQVSVRGRGADFRGTREAPQPPYASVILSDLHEGMCLRGNWGQKPSLIIGLLPAGGGRKSLPVVRVYLEEVFYFLFFSHL